jgi:hypothetical protein
MAELPGWLLELLLVPADDVLDVPTVLEPLLPPQAVNSINNIGMETLGTVNLVNTFANGVVMKVVACTEDLLMRDILKVSVQGSVQRFR